VKQLEDADRQQMVLFRKLIQDLAAKREDNACCSTAPRCSSAATWAMRTSTTTTNLPILLAGGGLKHGQHHAFKGDHDKPLCNLFVSMLQHLGVEADAFGSSTGTLAV